MRYADLWEFSLIGLDKGAISVRLIKSEFIIARFFIFFHSVLEFLLNYNFDLANNKTRDSFFDTQFKTSKLVYIIHLSSGIDCLSFYIHDRRAPLSRIEWIQHTSSKVKMMKRKNKNKNATKPELCCKAFQWFPLTKGARFFFLPFYACRIE